MDAEERVKTNGKKDIEEGEINAYMEDGQTEIITETDRIQYLEARYKDIKTEYKALRLQKSELDERPNSDEFMVKLTTAFRNNYLQRRWLVQELRNLGEFISDPFVP